MKKRELLTFWNSSHLKNNSRPASLFKVVQVITGVTVAFPSSRFAASFTFSTVISFHASLSSIFYQNQSIPNQPEISLTIGFWTAERLFFSSVWFTDPFDGKFFWFLKFRFPRNTGLDGLDGWTCFPAFQFSSKKPKTFGVILRTLSLQTNRSSFETSFYLYLFFPIFFEALLHLN